eukprot:CAMPEP_0115859568 /NCGR_PEP_ID=MMETSP0287-20121206/16683_1 /TAXON_ID=412157 /ORGANISM="Chrysochromulina rotalis, Strain UIO044" /LENGTH=83 /DNA_ID=CAMNT_0003313873 /DNA_START=528 /DNA_END=776 /DNA_ORIENTATION=+
MTGCSFVCLRKWEAQLSKGTDGLARERMRPRALAAENSAAQESLLQSCVAASSRRCQAPVLLVARAPHKLLVLVVAVAHWLQT